MKKLVVFGLALIVILGSYSFANDLLVSPLLTPYKAPAFKGIINPSDIVAIKATLNIENNANWPYTVKVVKEQNKKTILDSTLQAGEKDSLTLSDPLRLKIELWSDAGVFLAEAKTPVIKNGDNLTYKIPDDFPGLIADLYIDWTINGQRDVRPVFIDLAEVKIVDNKYVVVKSDGVFMNYDDAHGYYSAANLKKSVQLGARYIAYIFVMNFRPTDTAQYDGKPFGFKVFQPKTTNPARVSLDVNLQRIFPNFSDTL